MRFLMSALSLSMLAAAPLAAEGLAQTHQELAVPAGKINAKAFRPLAPQPCVAHATNPSSSRPGATQPVQSAESCAVQQQQVASRS